MRITLIVVGKLKGPLAEAVGEFERRAARYFSFESVEVREEPGTSGKSRGFVLAEEGRRLLARLPAGHELIALHRKGQGWSSERLAEYLEQQGLHSSPGVAFVIGGALGLSDDVISRAKHLLSLSAMTLPHDLARLVVAEQIYRAGTILRGEPYHKGTRD